VKIWRRSFDVPPPVLEDGSEFDLKKDPRYAGIAIPSTESLKLTIARVLPYYEAAIVPQLKAGETVIVAAHGNSCARWSSICRTFRTRTSSTSKSPPASRSSTNWTTI
jgi:bisphosphoglycerate-dependent phosphoglycerate mutase family 1